MDAGSVLITGRKSFWRDRAAEMHWPDQISLITEENKFEATKFEATIPPPQVKTWAGQAKRATRGTRKGLTLVGGRACDGMKYCRSRSIPTWRDSAAVRGDRVPSLLSFCCACVCGGNSSTAAAERTYLHLLSSFNSFAQRGWLIPVATPSVSERIYLIWLACSGGIARRRDAAARRGGGDPARTGERSQNPGS